MCGPTPEGMNVSWVNGNEPTPRCKASTRQPFILLRRPSVPSYNTPPCEAPMPFSIRHFRRLPVLCSMILVSMAAISLASCATRLDGTVSAVSYSAPPQPPTFIVISPDSLSLTERNISALIEAKMSKRGYQKANSIESANVGVMYKYSIDPSGSIYSVPNYSTGG
jgi:hypothetical protein